MESASDSASANEDVDVESVPQSNGFILGSDLSSSVESPRLTPMKSGWSNSLRNARHSTRNSTQFSNIRNRSYALTVSPQKQPPISRTRRSGLGGEGGTSVQHSRSSNILNGKEKPPKRKRISTKSHKKKTVGDNSKNAHLKVLKVASRSASKWTPICEQAKSLLLESIMSSSRVNMSRRKCFDEEMGKVVTTVKRELVAATAPTTRRLKSYSNLNSIKGALESKISSLVKRNDDVNERLESLQSQAVNQLTKVKNINSENINGVNEDGSAISVQTRNHHSKDWTSESEDAFGDYLKDLVESSRHSLMR